MLKQALTAPKATAPQPSLVGRALQRCRRAWQATVQWVARIGARRGRRQERGQEQARVTAPAAPPTPADDAFWDPRRPLDRRTVQLWHKQLEKTKLNAK
jgi:hypothetical protein